MCVSRKLLGTFTLTVAVLLVGVATPAFAASSGKGGTTTCKRSCTTDTIAPTVAVAAPSAGAVVSGSISATGTSGDNVSVSRVELQIDAAPFQTASGTTNWSASVDTRAYANGSHTLTARATDSSGNTATSTVTVSVSNGASTNDVRLSDPNATHGLSLFGTGKMASSGTVTTLLYWETFTSRRAAFFRDASSGATSYVSLPVDSVSGWSNANYVIVGSHLWILGGDGPVYVRDYQLSGTPVPTSAVLASTRTFGDTDSRQGDLTALASGALVAVWHQQGSTGPEGIGIGYRSPAGGWQTLTDGTQFTTASKQVVAQHPVDNSVWIFNDADGWGRIGALHLTERSSSLVLDWSDPSYILDQKYGEFAPDPENPDLQVAPDASTGSLVLAYQSAVRQMYSTNPVVTGSQVAVAHIGTSGPTSFVMLPVYVERISALGLVVRPGEIWLAYRPIDPATLTFDKLYANVYRNGAWASQVLLGTLADRYGPVGSGIGRPEFAANLADGGLHFLSQ